MSNARIQTGVISQAVGEAKSEVLLGELHLSQYMSELLQRVSKKVMPVWPLKDFVAVNPYAGLSHQSFLKARMGMRSISDAEMLMPMAYYVEQFAQGNFGLNDIRAALFELGETHETLPTFDEIRQTLQGFERGEGLRSELNGVRRTRLKTFAEFASDVTNEDWSERVLQEVSKHCVAHFDEGQAVWRSPWRELPLYCAWKEAAAIDRAFEWLGVQGFRRFVSKLPCSAEACIASSLQSLGVPFGMWEQTLTCYAYSMHGWSAWAKYKAEQGDKAAIEADELSGLIAIRMAYDVALAEHLAIRIDWESYKDWGDHLFSSTNQEGNSDPTVAIRYVLLRAHEVAFRSQVLTAIKAGREQDKGGAVSSIPFRSPVENSAGATARRRSSERRLAQMVFCIDVRSERLRRHLEEASNEIETFGFAGFFGMPFAYARFGESTKEGCSPDAHLPVLLKPRFQVEEGACGCSEGEETKALHRKARLKSWRKGWKEWASSATGCFAFVESVGWVFGWKLLQSNLWTRKAGSLRKGDSASFSRKSFQTGPTLRGLAGQGISLSKQVDLAEGLLRGLGLTDFARFVVFCGHASRSSNNPLAASLDCGACGGHSGEPNARFAAMLLNQGAVRKALAERQIHIPDDTVFVGALHETTNDHVEFFDLQSLPDSHLGDMEELREKVAIAGGATKNERANQLFLDDSNQRMASRSSDWSELRPEWGLAGNAAFVIAPRGLTCGIPLDGRAFLHSYDYEKDPTGAILEQIMTAPVVVANWINMQYYASMVDGDRFGSGNKTLHNVVGNFGLLVGSGGDLRTGLPWQSLHDGEEWRHQPLRLQVIAAAPRAQIETIVAKHPLLMNLFSGNWMHLIAIEGRSFYRFTRNRDGDLRTDRSPSGSSWELIDR